MRNALIGVVLLVLAGGKVAAVHVGGMFDHLGIAFPLNIFRTVLTKAAEAEEKSPVAAYLDSLPPMAPEKREAFDKAARSMYDASCNCITFLMGKEVLGFPLPLSDSDRQLFLLMLERKMIVPLDSSGPKY